MASQRPPSFMEKEMTHLSRSRKLDAVVITKSLHTVFSWGTSKKGVSENALDYLTRKEDKHKTISKFKMSLSEKQRELIVNDPSGSMYDIPLLFSCIKYVCDLLAPPEDTKWRKTNDSDLESLILSTYEFPNDLVYILMMNKEQFMHRTERLWKVIEKMLIKAGQLYCVADSIISQTVGEIRDLIDYVRDSSFVHQDYADNKKVSYFLEQRRFVCQRVRELLSILYDDWDFVLPISKLLQFKFKVRDIYTNMIIKDLTDDLVAYMDILSGHMQNKKGSIIIVKGLPGMGKTVLLKLILSDWISGHGVMKKLTGIELLLYVECKNSCIDTFEKLLEFMLPDLCKIFKMDEIVRIINDLNTLVLIDGLEELNPTSTKLLKELLDKKQELGLTILATSRLESVSSFHDLLHHFQVTTKILHLSGIPRNEMANFVTRYQTTAKNNGIECQDSEDFLQILQEEDHRPLGFLYKSPYNVAVTSIMWNDNPTKVNSTITPPELYFHIHNLRVERILERLQRHTDCQNLSSHILRERLDHLMYALGKEALISLNKGLGLSEESVERLLDCCSHNKLPSNEILCYFLKDVIRIKPSERRQMSFYDEVSQSLLASLYLWMEVHQDKTSPDKMKYLKICQSAALASGMGPAWNAHCMTLISGVLNECSPKSSHDGAFVVRNLLPFCGDVLLLSAYRKVFINLLMMFYLEKTKENQITKKEILNLLQESGVKSRDQWMDVVRAVNCDDFVLKSIAGMLGVMESRIEVNKYNVFPYAQLFKIEQPKIISLEVKGDPHKVLHMKKLFSLVKHHGIKVENIMMNDENVIKTSNEVGIKNLLSVDLTTKMDTSASLMNEVLKIIKGYEIPIRKLWLLYHFQHPGSPFHFESILEHLDKSYSDDVYVGPVTGSTTLPKRLSTICAAVTDLASYGNLCNIIEEQSKMERLSVCIPLTMAPEPLESCKVRFAGFGIGSFYLYVPDIHDDASIDEAMLIVQKVWPYRFRIKRRLCLPRMSTSCHQVKNLLLKLLRSKLLQVDDSICLPVSCCSSEEERMNLHLITDFALLIWTEEETLWNPSEIERFDTQLRDTAQSASFEGLASVSKSAPDDTAASSSYSGKGSSLPPYINRFDPFKVFEVEHVACLDFEITIKKGEAITKGNSLKDFVDTPAPYVILRIPGCSNSSKRTSHVDNSPNPIWDETFHFYLDPAKEHNLEVTLMDANYTLDETLGEDTFCVNQLTNDVPIEHTFCFSGGSKVHTILRLENNKKPDLRFSLALCREEKEFLRTRRKKVLVAMQKVLGPKAPDNEKQVPILGILGSGGGFRAMTCLSGAIKALHETGILDCSTFIAGLSGSSWYISTLYAHDQFPRVTHSQLQSELRDSVTTNWKWQLLKGSSYVADMVAKYKRGQPVSFTDFFGHLLGDILLKGKKHKKLTDMQKFLVQGIMPLPLFTCLHAKRNVSCRSFSEWVEFSPYEIGIAKYGTFMKTQDFGNRFIVGKKIKYFEELPLHFLQGVWGSAFTILFKRLVMEGGKKDIVQIMRDAQKETESDMHNKLNEENASEEDSESEDEEDIDGNDDVGDDDDNLEFSTPMPIDPQREGNDFFFPTVNAILEDRELATRRLSEASKRMSLDPEPKKPSSKMRKGFSFEFPKFKSLKDDRKISDPGPRLKLDSQTATNRRLSRQGAVKGSPRPRKQDSSEDGQESQNAKNDSGVDAWTNRKKILREKKAEKKAGLWDGLKQNIMTGTKIINFRAGRAEVLNPFRGLSLRQSFPISPFAGEGSEEEEELSETDSFGKGCRYEPLDNRAKKLFVVDSGLSFNSPFPLLLRPQRAVDIYLSFDFSERPEDSHHPFKELLLAEQWAFLNKVPFPPIKKLVEEFKKDEVRECYIFKHPSDQFCPVILHFPLVNNLFREFKAPGVPRTTDEEKSFADFSIFDDPSNPYSSMNFIYEEIQFDRLTQLVEFNTLSCIDIIKEQLEEVISRKKQYITKPLSLSDVVNTAKRVASIRKTDPSNNLKLKITEENERQLKKFVLNSQTSTDGSESEYSDALEEQPELDDS